MLNCEFCLLASRDNNGRFNTDQRRLSSCCIDNFFPTSLKRMMAKRACRSGCHERAEHENNRSSGRGRNHGIPPGGPEIWKRARCREVKRSRHSTADYNHDSIKEAARRRVCFSHTRPVLHIGSPHIFPGGALLLLLFIFFCSLTVSAPDCKTHSKASHTLHLLLLSPSSIFLPVLYLQFLLPLWASGGEKSRVSWSRGEVFLFLFLISTPHFNVIFFSLFTSDTLIIV